MLFYNKKGEWVVGSALHRRPLFGVAGQTAAALAVVPRRALHAFSQRPPPPSMALSHLFLFTVLFAFPPFTILLLLLVEIYSLLRSQVQFAHGSMGAVRLLSSELLLRRGSYPRRPLRLLPAALAARSASSLQEEEASASAYSLSQILPCAVHVSWLKWLMVAYIKGKLFR